MDFYERGEMDLERRFRSKKKTKRHRADNQPRMKNRIKPRRQDREWLDDLMGDEVEYRETGRRWCR